MDVIKKDKLKKKPPKAISFRPSGSQHFKVGYSGNVGQLINRPIKENQKTARRVVKKRMIDTRSSKNDMVSQNS